MTPNQERELMLREATDWQRLAASEWSMIQDGCVMDNAHNRSRAARFYGNARTCIALADAVRDWHKE